jgi:hypothetical protein
MSKCVEWLLGAPAAAGVHRCFKGAVDKQLDPASFVEGLKKQGKRVPGIGHRIKSKDNRDARVELLQRYARKVGSSCCTCAAQHGLVVAWKALHAQQHLPHRQAGRMPCCKTEAVECPACVLFCSSSLATSTWTMPSRSRSTHWARQQTWC